MKPGSRLTDIWAEIQRDAPIDVRAQVPFRNRRVLRPSRRHSGAGAASAENVGRRPLLLQAWSLRRLTHLHFGTIAKRQDSSWLMD